MSKTVVTRRDYLAIAGLLVIVLGTGFITSRSSMNEFWIAVACFVTGGIMILGSLLIPFLKMLGGF